MTQKPKTKKFPVQGRSNDNQERGDRRQKDVGLPKQKFIKKRFDEGGDNRRDNNNRRELQERKPQREKPAFERKEEGEKQFRTLKVMGLSPEFTNDDLYVSLK